MSKNDLPPDEQPNLDRDEKPGSESGVMSDPEIRALLYAASADTQPLFEFPHVEGEDGNEVETAAPLDTQDPEKAYALWYKKRERMLRRYLPKGHQHAEARSLIRDQINLYLKEGHETGRDSRQAYHHLMEGVVVVLQDWIDSGGNDLYGLYSTFRDMNISAGNLKV